MRGVKITVASGSIRLDAITGRNEMDELKKLLNCEAVKKVKNSKNNNIVSFRIRVENGVYEEFKKIFKRFSGLVDYATSNESTELDNLSARIAKMYFNSLMELKKMELKKR